MAWRGAEGRTGLTHSRESGRTAVAVAAALIAVGSCGPAEVVGPPGGAVRSVAVTPGQALLTHLGETVRFTAAVRRDSGSVGGGGVRWESTDASVVAVDGSGVATARGNGTAEVRASLEGVSGTATVTVEQRPAALSVFGDGQRTLAGLPLPGSVGVLVQDAGGRPVAGVAVRFAVVSGGGSVDPASAVSDGSGVASVAWTLGGRQGEQRVVASAAGGLEAEVRATAVDPNSVVARVVLWSGGRQEGVAGRSLPEPVVVQALDASALPVPGALVRFAVVSGGSADPGSARTDSAGRASTVWTLGGSTGSQELRVSVGSSPALQVTATAHPDGGICGRTRAVVEELLRRTGRSDCQDVTESDLGSVRDLYLREKGISKLRAGDFEGLSELRSLNLAKNRLASLPPDMFDDLKALRYLHLTGNQLESLPPLVGLRALTELRLGSNRLTEIPAGLADLTGLTELIMSSNLWVELPADLFARMKHLTRLFVNHAGLEKLDPQLFDGPSRLRELTLAGNRLSRLPPGVFDGLPDLQTLWLERNRLAELPPDAFANQRNLVSLSLGHNELAELPPGVFANLGSLERLYVDDNRLIRLDPDVFARLPNLEVLHLQENEFAELPADLFAGLGRLGILLLSDNGLAELPAGLFAGLGELSRLRLAGNQLLRLPPGLFDGLSRLDYLELSTNRLAELPPDIFAGLGELRELRLEQNGLTALPGGVFDGLRSLTQLYVNSNRIEELPPGVFRGLTKLEQLDFKSNPGAPFPLTVELRRTDTPDVLASGPANVVAHVPAGMPLFLTIPVSVQGGTASGAGFSVAAGDTASAALEVRRPPGSSGPAHVSLGAPPALPSAFRGLELAIGEQMALFAPPGNRPPMVTEEVLGHWLQAGGRSAEVDLRAHFADADGDTLVHEARSNDAAAVAVRIEAGVLVLEPVSEGSAVVEVAAEDPAGLRAVLEVRVTVAPTPDPNGYDIEVIFDDGFTASEEMKIRRAAARWEEVVTGDLPAVPADDIGFCLNSRGRRLVGVVDDVLIKFFVERETKERLASAWWCADRESGPPVLGEVRINRRYFEPDTQYDLYFTALHEIGHVLGIGGGRWREILQDRTTSSDPGPRDTHFPGPLAVEAFNEAGGRPYAGAKVPVETDPGLANVHWRQSVLAGELMSPYGGALSAITLQALADQGYEVDLSGADPYTLPGADRAPGSDAEVDTRAASLFAGDVIEGPLIVVDENGRVVRIIGGN